VRSLSYHAVGTGGRGEAGRTGTRPPPCLPSTLCPYSILLYPLSFLQVHQRRLQISPRSVHFRPCQRQAGHQRRLQATHAAPARPPTPRQPGHPHRASQTTHTAPARPPRQATRPVADHRGRPPARGGPTIYDPSTSGTSRPYIVGPPLAGGLRWPYYIRPLHQRHEPPVYSRATPCGLTRGGFLEKFVVKSLERATERVALGTLLHRIPRPIRPKTSPCKPLAGGLRRPEVNASGATPCGWPAAA
jgi:hypothetical protein